MVLPQALVIVCKDSEPNHQIHDQRSIERNLVSPADERPINDVDTHFQGNAGKYSLGYFCGQRTARPPQMQRARMPVADGFLARRGGVDIVQRQGDFDEFFGGFDGHSVSVISKSPDGE